MPRKPEHVKDPAEDAARMAEYAAQREEAIRAKAAHAEEMKQRHRDEQRALERARRADLADEQRRAEQEAQAAAQRERRADLTDEQRRVEQEAQAAAQCVTGERSPKELPCVQRALVALPRVVLSRASGGGRFGRLRRRVRLA